MLYWCSTSVLLLSNEKEGAMKTLKAVFIVLVAVLFFGWAAAAESQGFDWPRWGGPNANWISQETDWNPNALAGGPRVLWKADVGIGYSNVAIKDNRLYTMGLLEDNNVVFCLNAETGKTIWKYSFESMDDSQSTPTVDGGSVYTLSKEGILLCLNAQNGKLRWKKDIVSDCGAVEPFYGFAGSLVIEENVVIVTANTYGMALNKNTGEMVWRSAKPPNGFPTYEPAATTGTEYTTPVVYSQGGERYALISSYAGLHAVNAKTGDLLWRHPWELCFGCLEADPLVIGNKIYVDGDFVQKKTRASLLLQMTDGRPAVLWTSPDLVTDTTNPVLVDGFLYGCHGGPAAGTSPASLRCLELGTGRLLWQDTLGEPPRKGVFSLIAADGKLIVLNDKGILFIAEASPSGFKPISKADVLRGEETIRRFYSPPVLCNGRIYCRNYAGELICIDVRK